MIEKNQLYTGYFDDEIKILDTSIYKICPSCGGDGKQSFSDDDEIYVRCYSCAGDGYVDKDKDKDMFGRKL